MSEENKKQWQDCQALRKCEVGEVCLVAALLMYRAKQAQKGGEK